MIIEIKEPTKKLKEIRAKLGSDYSIKPVDGEQCIYRKINSNYDLEVSGLNDNKENIDAKISVWKISPYSQVIETVRDITSLNSLSISLIDLVEKYQDLN
ncbi:hypothetical protein KQI42_15780 [Tissierella sp. MSJ-40]|uniref:Uncharacterized protein n=1 Tax=Tissierella simiarum TaxID=2841534 RepID=A0ABS6E973_9FIRM|nr:hypothetical protein [Tissierella simiarum]MBU5439475.1 hypothetical protein [Tissierella simiarum]